MPVVSGQRKGRVRDTSIVASRVTGIRAEWVLVETAAGGRQSPLFSGYRGNLSVGETDEDDLDIQYGGHSELEDAEQLAPGEHAIVRTYFLFREHADEFARHFPPGREFSVKEGNRTIASGRVLQQLTDEPSHITG